MWLINTALRRPIMIIVLVIGIALCSILAYQRMSVDIFPNLDLPVIYVAQPYGGMNPAQMESFLVSYYEYHFLYITGIEHVESKSIQGTGLCKLYFHPGTDMSTALAQVVSYVERARAFMPPGTVSPFVVRFDVGSVPVGQLVFSSDTKSNAEIQDLALFKVRPVFSTLPGVSAPPPFGGNTRTVVIHADPEKLRSYNMSPEEVTRALASGNTVLPSGNVRTGDLNRIAAVNSIVPQIKELADLPIRVGSGPTVFVRDIGTVENSSDILTGYALVNGRRTVYIPVTKRADASTLDVVNRVKAELPRMRSLVPDDIKISFEFDQSGYVTHAIEGLIVEGGLGALLTGLMVLLFLRDLRSALIVVITIPVALLTAVVALWLSGQTINIMTLGGLALAIGILVDEATVEIENIHTHLARGEPVARAVLAATQEALTPLLLALLSILAVFAPAFFMIGVARSLFIPLALAIGFSMLASYVLSTTLVPVLSIWLVKEKNNATQGPSFFDRLRERYGHWLDKAQRFRWQALAVYAVVVLLILVFVGRKLGTDIFPTVDAGQVRVRLRAPTGTRIERTEEIALKALDIIAQEAGRNNIDITLGYVGAQPPSFPVNTIYQWSSGPHEAVLQIALKPGSGVRVAELRERLRPKLASALPGTGFSFEAADIVSQIMNFGSATPIEVAISGSNLAANRAYAQTVREQMNQIRALRDIQFGQPLDYPTVDVNIDRERAGQLGVTVEQVSRSLVAATSSSRFTQPNYWRDPTSGTAYQVQVEIPQSQMKSIEDVESIPAMPSGAQRPLVGDVAQVSYGTMVGEYDRYNQQRMVTITANVEGSDLGSAANEVNAAIKRAGDAPKGSRVDVRGQVPQMEQTRSGLQLGLLIAIVAIVLLLTAFFQSPRIALVVLSTIPAVLTGVAITLWLTGTTLNVQSFMGAIMAIGVSVANAILLVTFAEASRRDGLAPAEAARFGAVSRLRPILMTSFAMIAGMIPIALAFGQGGEQTAPLGRAVIGGLAASTIAVLTILPLTFAIVQRRASRESVSLHPDDVRAELEA
jgi:multidrug efflux pump subunit AcrB